MSAYSNITLLKRQHAQHIIRQAATYIVQRIEEIAESSKPGGFFTKRLSCWQPEAVPVSDTDMEKITQVDGYVDRSGEWMSAISYPRIPGDEIEWDRAKEQQSQVPKNVHKMSIDVL